MGKKSGIKDFLLLSFAFCLSPFVFRLLVSPGRLSLVALSPVTRRLVARRQSLVATLRSPHTAIYTGINPYICING
jgi:hypothetical protein